MSSQSFHGSGIIFGNYEVVRDEDGKPVVLGQGAFGKTYRAVHTFLRSTVALKVMNEAWVPNTVIKKRFLKEAQAMARLQHPHVAQILDCGEVDGMLYYAVEFCGGGDLERLVRLSGALPPKFALSLARQAAQALKFVHDHGFLHRDLKPSNLMLTGSPAEASQLKVIDFGLVKDLNAEAAAGMTEMGQFLGTLHYASPEQMKEEPLDARSDIFSLGLTLWFLLHGGVPFEANRAGLVAKRLSGEGYEAQLSPEWPVPLRKLVARMIKLDREARPRTMEILLGELEECLLRLESPVGEKCDPAWENGHLYQPAKGREIEVRSEVEEGVDEGSFSIEEGEQACALGTLRVGRISMTGKRISLTFLSQALAGDIRLLGQLKAMTAKVRTSGVESLVQPLGICRHEDRLVLAEEWIEGPHLLSLLRRRRSLGIQESLPILKQVAEACDAARETGLPGLELSGHRVRLRFLETKEAESDGVQLPDLSTPIAEWPPFTVKIAPVYFSAPNAMNEMFTSEAPATLFGDDHSDFKPTSGFGRLFYLLLAGHPATSAATMSPAAYVSLSCLSERANTFLARCIAGQFEDRNCKSVLDMVLSMEHVQDAPEAPSRPTLPMPIQDDSSSPPIPAPNRRGGEVSEGCPPASLKVSRQDPFPFGKPRGKELEKRLVGEWRTPPVKQLLGNEPKRSFSVVGLGICVLGVIVVTAGVLVSLELWHSEKPQRAISSSKGEPSAESAVGAIQKSKVKNADHLASLVQATADQMDRMALRDELGDDPWKTYLAQLAEAKSQYRWSDVAMLSGEVYRTLGSNRGEALKVHEAEIKADASEALAMMVKGAGLPKGRKARMDLIAEIEKGLLSMTADRDLLLVKLRIAEALESGATVEALRLLVKECDANQEYKSALAGELGAVTTLLTAQFDAREPALYDELPNLISLAKYLPAEERNKLTRLVAKVTLSKAMAAVSPARSLGVLISTAQTLSPSSSELRSAALAAVSHMHPLTSEQLFEVADHLRQAGEIWHLPEAYLLLASIERDNDARMECYKLAESYGSMKAKAHLGLSFMQDGQIAKKEALVQQGLAKLREAVKAGDRDAMLFLGEQLYLGEAVPENATEAMQLARDAESKGHPDAFFLVARLELRAAEVSADPVRYAAAARMLEKAVKMGNPYAPYFLYIANWNKTIKDATAAVAALEKGCEAKDVRCLYALSLWCEAGTPPVSHDPKRARKLKEEVAALGSGELSAKAKEWLEKHPSEN